MNTTYTIARYEQMNKEDFLVAFNVQIEDYQIFYIESVLPLSSISEKTSQQVCQLAYENIKTKIEEFSTRLQAEKNFKIGCQFIPDVF
jgi:hypothetical protein